MQVGQVAHAGPPVGAGEDVDALQALVNLEERQATHPFWENRLFLACKAGALRLEDFRYVFSQYYLYSRNFTRYLAGLLANCEDDLLRARITENLWEESGGIDVEKRHAQIFRKFLQEGLGIPDLAAIEYADFSRYFVREYLDFILRGHPMEAAAFLSLGTEGIVARMYGIFVEGLTKAGVPEEQLTFFRLHMECDDAHAFTLQQVMLSYAGERGWHARCADAMERALTLRTRFFENLYDAIQMRRVRSLLEKIQARKSLVANSEGGGFRHPAYTRGTPLYTNAIEKLNIDFAVDKLPFQAEVLDPRMVRIPPGKSNEHHRHAHETVFFVLQGSGYVLIDYAPQEVKPGDIVFAPRWCMHQTQNTSNEEMLLLAITDFGLTGKGFLGDYDKTARMKRAAAAK
ncbi:iron-containing redox enzyme family protein [Pendulispora albinea]|uniref:Iron-containing redox enzyme family protein n=1 Tax=Pendulispora albinea TaxID=2741071 RepID=A0ABZ2LZN1_9BACT